MQDEVIILPEDGKQLILNALRSARRSIRLSVFRFKDQDILDELQRACQRGVVVRVLLSNRVKGWREKLRHLELALRAMGATAHRYNGHMRKYHAKYFLIDDELAFIMSFNLTKKCFRRTHDFGLVTRDAAVKAGLTKLFDLDWDHARNPAEALDGRLVISPINARGKLESLIASAEHSLQIIDHKISDAQMIRLVTERARVGVNVKILGVWPQDPCKEVPIEVRCLSDVLPHGKAIIIDGRVAVVGSISLSANNLEQRRELSAVTEDERCVARLVDFFEKKFHSSRSV
jgi:phosphatidylserine/phosphatidylglycerophosphate/cardiolipin synthase-like enzyme